MMLNSGNLATDCQGTTITLIKLVTRANDGGQRDGAGAALDAGGVCSHLLQRRCQRQKSGGAAGTAGPRRLRGRHNCDEKQQTPTWAR